MSLPPIDRITVFKGGALGDFLLTLPVLAALRARFPAARLRLITSPERASLVRQFGYEILDAGRREWAGLFDPSTATKIRDLLAEEDLLLVFSEAPLPPLPFLKSSSRAISIPSFPPPGERVHVTDFLFQRLRDAGLPLPPPSAFSLPPSALSSVSSSLQSSTFFVIHPGSGSSRKNWPSESFAAVARGLSQGRGLTPVILGGEADGETLAGLRKILGEERASFVENAPLEQVASILSRAAVYIGNDSGVTHLAAALGVPTLALFGPTDPLVWSPRGRRVEILSGTAPCSPCDPEKRRRCLDNVCMKSIPVERIIEATELLFAKPL